MEDAGYYTLVLTLHTSDKQTLFFSKYDASVSRAIDFPGTCYLCFREVETDGPPRYTADGTCVNVHSIRASYQTIWNNN